MCLRTFQENTLHSAKGSARETKILPFVHRRLQSADRVALQSTKPDASLG
ncbi:hypothetical protein EYZ11_003594 [Aspergillus tanneri]|uniref:Uncharacterized protein n=1 Tax=Aspergillus tanneri TaxID=1220188 RepID=A0A4S3JMZ2_9EURO|nr:hypothetical protein EYZ11_003594 [Aspergillus tanneri]